MLILLYHLCVEELFPRFMLLVLAILEAFMPIIICFVGIVLVFAAIGCRISANLGSTIVGGLFKAIAYVGKPILKAIGKGVWYLLTAVPSSVFNLSRQSFLQRGMSKSKANIFAFLIAALVVIIII